MATELLEGGNAYRIARALETIAISQYAKGGSTPSTFAEIAQAVQAGNAKKYFKIGDQIMTTWSPDGETVYDMPWDVVYFAPVTDENGVIHENAMWLQSHYALPPMPFYERQAFYVAPEDMPAGSYYFRLGRQVSQYVTSSTNIQFTTTGVIKAGTPLTVETEDGGDPHSLALSYWRVRAYQNGVLNEATDTFTVSEGYDGTLLGTLKNRASLVESNGLNAYNPVIFGLNSWEGSSLRQWLNSDAAAGGWWRPIKSFDTPSSHLNQKQGFIAGLQKEFAAIIKPIKVTTSVLGTTSIDDIDITYDKFFCAASNEEYCENVVPYEGEVWEYWVNRLGELHEQSVEKPEHIRYMIDNHTQAAEVALRSITHGYDYLFYGINKAGYYVNSDGTANYSYSAAPACVIY